MAGCVVCSNEIRDDARFCPACGAEQPKSLEAEGDDPFIGQTVAKNFKIEKILGVGGMGKVYKARQLSLDKSVVIKILHDHFRDDPQLVQRFQREARAASRLNHPNSIQVIDFGKDENGVLYMAIEFLEGKDLFSVLQQDGPMPMERIARIMTQVCSALADAHAQHVIHRDLKPENIMVEDRRGQKDYVKVLDFGIAKIQDPDDTGQALTQAGMVCGTPEYMSPEQARGMELDHRSDLYALGVLVFQLATGELPFHADSPIGIVTKHILEPPPNPREKYPQLNIPVGLEALMLKAMAKEADDRFQTAIEMVEAFEALVRDAFIAEQSGSHGHNVTPPPTTPTPTPPTPTPQPVQTPDTPVAVTKTTDPGAVVPGDTGGGGGLKMAAMGGVLLLLVAGGVGAFALFGPSGEGEGEGEGEVVVVSEGEGEKTGEGEGEATPDPNKVKADALRKQAADLWTAKDHKQAIAVQTELTTVAGDDIQAKLTLAQWQKDYAEILKAKTPPPTDDGEAELKKLRSYMKLAAKKKKWDRALKHAEKIKALNPGEPGIDDKIAEFKNPPKDVTPPKGGDRAKAQALFRQAQPLLFSDRDKAYDLLRQALQADATYYDAIRSIAFIHKKNGKTKKACAAINDYVFKKKLDAERANALRASHCQ